MKKKVILKLLIIGISIVFCLANVIAVYLEYRFNTPPKFVFELPLPKKIQIKEYIEAEPPVEKVIIAGFFSNWDPYNDNYRMKPEKEGPQNKKWTITLPLDPGEHQYKFVVHIKGREEPIWILDSFSKRSVSNNIGNYNSVIKVYTTKKIILVTNVILIGILLVFLTAYLVNISYKLKPKEKIKIYLAILLIFLLVNSMMIFVHLSRKSFQLQEKFYSYINILQAQILGSNIDLNSIDSYKNSLELKKSLDDFLWFYLSNHEDEHFFQGFSNFSVFIFDRNFRINTHAGRGVNLAFEKNIKDVSILTLLEFFQERIFNKIITNFKKKEINEQNYRLDSSKKNYFKSYFQICLAEKKLIHYYCFLYPIIYQYKTVGYYGIYYHTNLYNIFLKNLVVINIILTLLIFTTILISIAFLSKKKNKPVHTASPAINIHDKLTHQYGITNREMEIIQMISKGLSNKEISDKLFISRKTVDNHVYNIYHKANIKNRIELINLLVNHETRPD